MNHHNHPQPPHTHPHLPPPCTPPHPTPPTHHPRHFQERDGPWLPTLRILHQYPEMMKRLRTDKGAIKFVLSGANIMCPGLTHPDAVIHDEVGQRGGEEEEEGRRRGGGGEEEGRGGEDWGNRGMEEWRNGGGGRRDWCGWGAAEVMEGGGGGGRVGREGGLGSSSRAVGQFGGRQ